MASASSQSPVRYLDDRQSARSRRLHVVDEETDSGLSRQFRPMLSQIGLFPQSNSLDQLEMEIKRLRLDNQILREKLIYGGDPELASVKAELQAKNLECKSYQNEVKSLKEQLAMERDAHQRQTKELRLQVGRLQTGKKSDEAMLADKLSRMMSEDIEVAKQEFTSSLAATLEKLESANKQIQDKDEELAELTRAVKNMGSDHYSRLEYLASENVSLKGRIEATQGKLSREVREAESQRDLERSRSHGILSHSRENSAYMEREVRRLAEQLVEKSISVQSFTKDILKMERSLEMAEKRFEHQLARLQDDRAQKLTELEDKMVKMEKYYKVQLAQRHRRQFELCETIASRQNEIENLHREIEHEKHQLTQKASELGELRANMERLHEDHAKQISKVMAQSSVKRRSTRNLSEISSMREIAGESGGQLRQSLNRQNSYEPPQDGSSHQLYTVQEEIVKSQILAGSDDEEDLDLKELVLHYQGMIEQLRENKQLELKLASDKIKRLDWSLQQKQQEVLDILERFSPLMEFRLAGPEVEEERKAKIQQHLKADQGLLEVLLGKYKIAAVTRADS